MRNRHTSNRNQPLKPNVFLFLFDRSESLDRVEWTLAAMTDNCSPDFYYERLEPALIAAVTPEVDCDLMPHGFGPDRGEARFGKVETWVMDMTNFMLRRNLVTPSSVGHSHPLSPPSLARGSPSPERPVTFPLT